MTAAPSLTSSWSEPSVSEHEVARSLVEAQHHADQRRATVRVIAGAARGLDDARMLLDMLGLGQADIRAARPVATVPAGSEASPETPPRMPQDASGTSADQPKAKTRSRKGRAA